MSDSQLHSTSRALLVTPIYAGPEVADRIGQSAYSYFYVYQAFAPLLKRWAAVTEVTQPESRLDFAVRAARLQNQEPLHLSFLPLDLMYLTAQAPNVAFPFWEFPDIPRANLNGNPRLNWTRVADRADLILTACTFTRDAFVQAGVSTRINVVPVPIAPEYSAVPSWQADQRVVINCSCYVFPQPATDTKVAVNPWVPPPTRYRFTLRDYVQLRTRAKALYAHLTGAPRSDDDDLPAIEDTLESQGTVEMEPGVTYQISSTLELSGVVYTSIFNPTDARKNWRDLLSAFLIALGDREDATLVIKLVLPPEHTPAWINTIIQYSQALCTSHRCKLVIVPGYLSDEQMIQLTSASTYYLNTSHAEGACLPLQNFLAAGRPGIAPTHTAMADYFHDGIGFVVDSHREPASWLQDVEKRYTTTWNRLVWQSLHDQMQASYEVAKHNNSGYQALATRARAELNSYASAEAVWPLLQSALNSVSGKVVA